MHIGIIYGTIPTAMAKKEIIETTECLEFFGTMNESEKAEYNHHVIMLRANGCLSAPDAEKVEKNLFALRICTGGNARFFYAYDNGTSIWILNGYEKKTAKIPPREKRQALRLKRKYGL